MYVSEGLCNETKNNPIVLIWLTKRGHGRNRTLFEVGARGRSGTSLQQYLVRCRCGGGERERERWKVKEGVMIINWCLITNLQAGKVYKK